MTFQVDFVPEAKRDILDSIFWYNNQKENLGFDFYNKIEATITKVVSQPLSYAVRFKQVRAAKLEKFPYLIYFLLNEREDKIIIIAVLDTSRNAKEILDRS